MATLAPQSITDEQKQHITAISVKTGNSIASVVRGILQADMDKQAAKSEAGS